MDSGSMEWMMARTKARRPWQHSVRITSPSVPMTTGILTKSCIGGRVTSSVGVVTAGTRDTGNNKNDEKNNDNKTQKTIYISGDNRIIRPVNFVVLFHCYFNIYIIVGC